MFLYFLPLTFIFHSFLCFVCLAEKSKENGRKFTIVLTAVCSVLFSFPFGLMSPICCEVLLLFIVLSLVSKKANQPIGLMCELKLMR